ncbi:dnaJ homolog subfamily C member 3-like isoform X2 [Pecten maximus]|uniref:dnaJ homolog subfamily C member 3-like isoform X2 n=1 Tax=Pecten maximus TaxID=6579 RepID=UPI00145838F0|nr:dnaJ homolog subfamily C member 3-like isoform X2 [Pecten maximus]
MMWDSRSVVGYMTVYIVLWISREDIYTAGWFGSTVKENVFVEKGQALEAAGQLVDALAHYKHALEENPSNYLVQFRCGMVCIELGLSKQAMKFLDQAYELQPDFTEAIVERGSVHLKLGDLQSAKDDFNLVLRREPSNREVKLRIQQINGLKQDIPFAKLLFKQKDYAGCREALDQALALCTWDVMLREIRAECYLTEGKYGKAIADIRATLRHRRLKAPAYLKLSIISYDIGDTGNSLINIRECLKLDPDHKECDSHYRKVKTLVRLMDAAEENRNEMQNARCMKKAHTMLQIEPDVQYYVRKAKAFLCHCHLPTSIMDALTACDFVLDEQPDNIQVRMARADISMEIANDKLHQAMADYLYIKSRTEDNNHAGDGLKKTKELVKLFDKRDYYRILGLDRFASYGDIMQAYKTFAMVWHPDKFKGDNKKKAEKMFLDITAARDVLSDQRKRDTYDRGVDPLTPGY